MSISQEARLNLGFTIQEFSLLLNVPEAVVEEWETYEEGHGGALQSLFILLKEQPRQCGQVIIEYRITRLPSTAPEREALGTLIRKIHGSPTW